MDRQLLTPPKMTLGLTEACHLNCLHCYADCSAKPKPGELSLAQWKAVVDEAVADGVIQFYIEGGEPLCKPGCLPLVEHCARQALTLLRTHGALIDDATADVLKAAPVGRVLVDLMGARASTHEWFTGVAGSFEASCAGIRRLVAKGIATDILVILTRQTAPELNALLKLAAELGAKRVGVLRLYPLGRAKRRWSELSLSLAEQMQAIRSLDPPPGLGIMQSWYPNDRNCCWSAAAINAFGHAIGCMYLREYVDFGSALEMRHRDIWQHNPLYRHLRSGEVEQGRDTQGPVELPAGGCRSTAFAFHGRWTAPDPFDASLNAGTDLRVLP